MKLNPDTQVVATLGSKEGFANMAQAITAPGDVILVPNPTYPIHEFGFIISGAAMRHIPASVDHDFLVAVDKAVRHSLPKPLALVLSYPSNPTAIMASLDFYKEMVDYARKHDLILLSDVAYAEIYFGDEPPPSILQVPGAMDVAVEFTSLSKTYSMPGWRMGFAVGNERLVAALARVKSYLDYGAFTPIQVAAAAALNGPQECIEEMRQTYKRRRDCLVESLHRAGWDIPSPPGTMFAWAPLPESMKHIGSLAVFQASAGESPRGRFARRGLRRVRRRLCPPCAGRKRAPHPAGRPRDQEVPFVGGYAPAQRHPLRTRPGPLRARPEKREAVFR